MSDVNQTALARAIADWRARLGDAWVTTDAADLRRAETATFATSAAVGAILRPGSREEIQDLVRIASRHGVPIYPTSSGRNWGYGSQAPSRDAVLVDLGRLNRIVDFNEDLAYVTVEPGVTQRDLFRFLERRGSRLWMDATGASPACSIIGNTLERGFGHTPMGDHAAHACGFEVILPNGDLIDTGFSRFDGSKVGALGRWGLGPSIDGLFLQSNFGIVTRMTVWLMPAPERFQAFFFQANDDEGLARVVEALRPLRLDGTLRSVVHVGNDYKILSGTGQYPWGAARGQTPLRREAISALRREAGIGCWSGSGGLYGTRAQVREARRRVKRALAGKVDRLQFVDDRLLAWLPRVAPLYRWLTGHDLERTRQLLVPVYNLLKGVPTEHSLGSTYWRKRGPVPADPDPDRDRCGLIWTSPVSPSTGHDARAVMAIADDVMLAKGFEPIVSVSLMNERSIVSVIAITYDRDIPGEDVRALSCHEELGRRLMASGYPPYRLGLASMGLAASEPAYDGLLAALKRAVDPAAILAPGRYEPSALADRANPVRRASSAA
jgi:4-cresol dehydrogenase (hydroxylating)